MENQGTVGHAVGFTVTLSCCCRKGRPSTPGSGLLLLGLMHLCSSMSNCMVRRLGCSARLLLCETSISDSARGKVSWPRVSRWGAPQNPLLLSDFTVRLVSRGVKTLILKSCARPEASSHPFHPVLSLPNPCSDVRILAEITAMLDRIWGTMSRELCGCLGHGACCVLQRQAQRCSLEDLKLNGKTGIKWVVRAKANTAWKMVIAKVGVSKLR